MIDKPQTFAGDLHQLPAELTPLIAKPHWVLWRWEIVKDKDGQEKWTKPPYQPSGKKGKNNEPKTWSSYATVMEAFDNGAGFDGIGFNLLKPDICAFDIDKCRDPASGTIHPWALGLVAKCGSYTEITPSGTGLRIIGRGVGPKLHKKLAVVDGVTVELYRKAERYITISGLPLEPIVGLADIDAHIDEVYAELSQKKEQTKPGSPEDGGHHARQQIDDEDELERTIRDCDVPVGQRSERVWWVIMEMLRRGYLPATIITTLLDRKNKISLHIYDQAKPREKAEQQVAKAKKDIKLATDDHGIPHKSPANICVALLKLGITLRHDSFADRMLINGLADFGPALEDAAVNRIWLLMGHRFRFRPSKDLLHTVVEDVARLNGFHPVRDYLDGLQWDGTKRIDKWLTTYGGAEDNEYTRAVGALMLVAAVRRVRKPGIKFDEMLVLENPEQGTDKSTALATLAVQESWFSDDMPLNIEGKRVIETLRGRWIIETAELSGMHRTDIEHVKAQLSRQIDRARMSYGRIVSEAPRQCVFFGTTNSVEFLRDTTGNRRFWPVRVKRFDVAALLRDRNQLWAEAATRETSGDSIRLDAKLYSMAAEEQAQRLTADPYYEALHHVLGDRKGKISSEDVWQILDIKAGQRGQDQGRRMGDAMRALGWSRPNKSKLVRIGGRPVVGWVKGEQPWEQVEMGLGSDNEGSA